MKITTLLFAAFLGFGCAAKKMVASNADILLENQIEKRLPLYSGQKDELSKDIDKFLNDQKTWAKEIVPLITDIELDVDKVDTQYDKLREKYKELALKFSKLMSKHMAPLDEKQQKDFVRTLKEENHKIKKGEDELMEKLHDRFETLFGTISDKQKKILDEQKKHFENRHQVRLSRREKLHERFAEIFEMDASKEAKAQYFYTAFEDYQNSYPDSPKNKEIIKSIIPTLSNEQKEVFESKVKDLKEILSYYVETHY